MTSRQEILTRSRLRQGDGLRNPDVMAAFHDGLKTRDGRLWFATMEGAAVDRGELNAPTSGRPEDLVATPRVDLTEEVRPPGTESRETGTALSLASPDRCARYRSMDTTLNGRRGEPTNGLLHHLPAGAYVFRDRRQPRRRLSEQEHPSHSSSAVLLSHAWFCTLCVVTLTLLATGSTPRGAPHESEVRRPRRAAHRARSTCRWLRADRDFCQLEGVARHCSITRGHLDRAHSWCLPVHAGGLNLVPEICGIGI